jgi:hypothetical protein
MTSYCAKKIIENFGQYIAKKDIESVLKEISNMQASGMDRIQIRKAMEEIIGALETVKVGQAIAEFHHARVLNENVDYIMKPEFKGDINQALSSKLFRDSTAVEGSGLNVENLREGYRNQLVTGLDMTLMSRSPELVSIARSGELDIEILDHMSGATKSTNPMVIYLAEVYKGYTDKLFSMYSNSGIHLAYKNDYFFRRVYDGEKIREMGFVNWASATVSKLNVKDSFKNIVDKDISEVAEMFMKGATEDDFKKLAEFGDNRLVAELFDDYKRYQNNYDKFSMEAYSKILEKQDNIGDRRLKRRSYVFKSNADMMSYMQEVGIHSNMYDYLKTMGYTAARELAMVDVFGPSPMRGVDDLIKYIDSKSLNFNENAFREKLAYATGKVKRVDPSMWKAFKAQDYEKLFAASQQKASAITAASLLGASGITQILDMSSTATFYYMKSNRNLLMASVDIIKNIPSTLADWNKASILGEVSSDLEKITGEEMLKEFKDNWAGAVADKVLLLSGAKFVNKLSTRLNLRLYTKMLGDLSKDVKAGKELSDFHNRFLAKWGMTSKDLIFAEGLLKYIDSPKDIKSLPDDLFIDNPAGVNPLDYKTELSKKVYAFLLENTYQGSPKAGWAQQYYANGYTADQNAYRASAARALMQFKSIPIKQFADARQLTNLKGGYKNKSYHGAYVFGGLAATVMLGGFIRQYAIDLIKNMGDYEEVNKKYMDDDYYKDIFIDSFFKYGPWSLATEPFGNAINSYRKRGTFQTEDITTPAANLMWIPPVIAAKAVASVMDGEPALDKNDTKRIIRLGKTIFPAQSHWSLLPIAEERKNFEEELAIEFANYFK